jgi:hypothetical protein
MVEVSGWSWCHRCGHREELRQTRVVRTAADLAAAPAPKARPTSELGLAFRLIPAWGWVLCFGLCLIAAFSGVADYRLPVMTRERAVLSTSMVLGGLVVFLITGIMVPGRLPAMHHALRFTDLLFPDRLWVLAIRHLPATRWYVCVGAWALMAVLCGIFWIGSLTYWLPVKGKPTVTKIPGISQLGNASSKPDVIAEDPKDKPEETDPERPDKPMPQELPKTVTKCLIVGYTTQNGELAEVLVATVSGEDVRYAGRVPVSKDPEERKDLLARLRSLETNTSVFPDLDVKATWLKPRLSCEVESTGVNTDLRLQAPVFKGLILPKQPEPVRLPAGDGKDDKSPRDNKTSPSGKTTDDKKTVPSTQKPGDKKTDPGPKKTGDSKDAGTKDRTPPK